MSEAVVKNASVKYFCPSRLMIFVVVLGGHLGGSFAAITSLTDVWPPSAARNYFHRCCSLGRLVSALGTMDTMLPFCRITCFVVSIRFGSWVVFFLFSLAAFSAPSVVVYHFLSGVHN